MTENKVHPSVFNDVFQAPSRSVFQSDSQSVLDGFRAVIGRFKIVPSSLESTLKYGLNKTNLKFLNMGPSLGQ